MRAPTLADVATSAAAALGLPGVRDLLGIGPARQVVVCLVDGLGDTLLDAHRDLVPRLAGLDGGRIRASFPTTTPVGLASFGTGMLPGAHGLVGASFLLPETERILQPLHWGDVPVPVAVQPERTVFERLTAAGVAAVTVSPGAYETSGLTRAVLRGSRYRPAEDIGQRVAGVVESLAETYRSFTYVYWSELDRVGHEFGVDSEQWRSALVRVDDLVGRLVEALVPGSVLVVTADHGMVDCPVEDRIQVEEESGLLHGVDLIAGEPRTRHVYARPGAASDVAATWAAVLGDRARVWTRAQLVETGLLGPVDPALAGRIGDVVVVCQGRSLLATRDDPLVSSLIGQHGALTDDELWIPALVARGAAPAQPSGTMTRWRS